MLLWISAGHDNSCYSAYSISATEGGDDGAVGLNNCYIACCFPERLSSLCFTLVGGHDYSKYILWSYLSWRLTGKSRGKTNGKTKCSVQAIVTLYRWFYTGVIHRFHDFPLFRLLPRTAQPDLLMTGPPSLETQDRNYTEKPKLPNFKEGTVDHSESIIVKDLVLK